MDKRIVNEGFILVELLVVILVIGIMLQFSLVFRINDKNLKVNQFITDLLFYQTVALSKYKSIIVQHEYISNVNYLSFNQKGHINQAQTIMIDDINCTVLLSLGRIRCENDE